MANQPLTAEQFAPCDTPQAPSGRSGIEALPHTSAVAVLGAGVANGKIGAPQRRPAATASLARNHLCGQSEVHRPPGSSVLSRHHNGEGKQSVSGRRENNQPLTRVVVVSSDKEAQVLRGSVVPPDSQISAQILRRRGPRIALVLVMIVTVLSAGVSLAPSALADLVANLKDAVAQARGGTSCGPLRSDSVVEQVAEKINRSTNDWLDHTATQVPIEDPLPGLKILGYGGSKAKLLQGAARTDADAIKGMLLEGLDAIPDCSYKDFGASMLRNEASDHYLTAVVLADA
jgi:hypothetical protein